MAELIFGGAATWVTVRFSLGLDVELMLRLWFWFSARARVMVRSGLAKLVLEDSGGGALLFCERTPP